MKLLLEMVFFTVSLEISAISLGFKVTMVALDNSETDQDDIESSQQSLCECFC